MTNKDVEDSEDDGTDHNKDSPSIDSDDEEYAVHENTPDLTILGHKIVSSVDSRFEVMFIKLVMERLKVITHSFTHIYSCIYSLI